MRGGFVILIFMVVLQLSFAAITLIVPGFGDTNNNGVIKNDYITWAGGQEYDKSEATVGEGLITLTSSKVQSNNATATATGPGWFIGTTGSFFNSVLDLATSNFMSNAIDFVKQFVFGVPNVIGRIFNDADNPDSYFHIHDDGSFSSFQTTIGVVMALTYFFSVVWLFSGRNPFKEGL
jgi:hypothetical protein